MKNKVWNLNYDFLEIEELVKTREASFIKTGVYWWDSSFNGLQRGAIQLVAAPTGRGKTSFLLAMARKLIDQGLKVIYVGTEQTVEDMYLSVGPLNLYYTLLPYGTFINTEMVDYFKEKKFDVVIYDYLGGNGNINPALSDWRDLMEQVALLDAFAKENQVAILTAIQADDSINLIGAKDVPDTGQYISFSKHILDKVTVACYLIKEGESLAYLKCIKNRYGRKPDKLMELHLNYRTKCLTD